jgi:uncharacterized protein (TIGR03032 family)
MSQQLAGETISCEYTRNFPVWLIEQKCSLLVSTYKHHKLLCLGVNQGGSGDVTLVFTNLMRPMGVFYDEKTETIYASNLGNIVQYENTGEEKHAQWGYFDALFVPKRIDFCNDMDIHDVRVGVDPSKPDSQDSVVYFVSAIYNSVVTTSNHKSFKLFWTPKFITKNGDLPPCEDRCHLNGLCLVDGKPKYATAACQRDYYYAWKEHHGEGVVIDIETDEIVCTGLWAPHSPIWHKGRLYIGEAGTGQFGYVDLEQKKFVPKKFLPGFIRGISHINNFAVINISDDRHDMVFQDIPLGKILKERGQKPFCGICVVDLNTFDILHYYQLKFSTGHGEIYDIAVIPNYLRPRIAELHELRLHKFDIEV